MSNHKTITHMSELNEKIVELLESDVLWETHEFSPPDFNLESAAKAIEILVLEQQLEMLNSTDSPVDIVMKRMDLEERLKQLKQQ